VRFVVGESKKKRPRITLFQRIPDVMVSCTTLYSPSLG
jgi:hypothetical protein